LLHVFPSFAIGGQQTRFATIAGRLETPYRHVVVSLDGRDMARALVPPSVNLNLRPPPSDAPGPLRLVAIAGAIRAVRPDALVTYNWGSIEWAAANRLLVGRPHVHLEDGFGPDEADRQHGRRVLARRLVLRRSTVVVPSRVLARIAVGAWRLAERRVRYVPNGIDAARFDAVPDVSRFFDRGSASFVLGAVAPLRAEKNLGRLLRAFARVGGGALLVIGGDGPEAGRLRALAAELGLGERVVFTGHVPAPELIMGGFDAFAITSDTEQMPYAVLEAMCAGLPVIGTDVGDIASMVHAENRPFIVPRDAPERLALAIEALRAAPDLRRAVGAANRAEVRARFGIGQMSTAFAAILDAAVEGDRARPG
jgi:glycosyltransferase involved in cell wall biosynthesis